MDINQAHQRSLQEELLMISPRAQWAAMNQIPSLNKNSPRKQGKAINLEVKGFGMYQMVEVYCS